MSTAFDYIGQVKRNTPKIPFEKGRKVYGVNMEDAPRNNTPNKPNTDFTTLLALRKRNANKSFRASKRAAVFTALGMILFLIVLLVSTMERLP
ncbi:hypothetical protein [Roseivirga pacifica]